MVVTGCPTVLIGNPPVGPDGRAMAIPPECAFLKDFANATGRKLGRLRDHVSTTTPIAVDVRIPGDSTASPMLRREVWVRGHKVTVYEPAGGAPPGKWLPSGENIAEGLGTLSDEQLRNLKEVYVVPHDGPPNPKTGALPAADYGAAPGTIRYFPRAHEHPQSDIDWALQHESGHGYSLGELWAKDSALRDQWKRAIAADRRSVTTYGDSNEVEDFAEFVILYSDVLGTPCEASARALYPNRMRAMDKVFPNGIPTRNPKAGQSAY
jgi:hypothetical protein